ncbi:hypothetical protein SAMN05660443_0267 [Marinospirillum celere]|uniref:Uncharacterized protein n=1 Tax=Marinospirillum celere TaxID=1122252 RepID=A0A1I1E1R4_9GAMM|nr:hypothetical protein [Marinospirillum celere]SFB81014.1 hypothetical protein SAMN05660443_0267 [Marinospirillum celere]
MTTIQKSIQRLAGKRTKKKKLKDNPPEKINGTTGLMTWGQEAAAATGGGSSQQETGLSGIYMMQIQPDIDRPTSCFSGDLPPASYTPKFRVLGDVKKPKWCEVFALASPASVPSYDRIIYTLRGRDEADYSPYPFMERTTSYTISRGRVYEDMAVPAAAGFYVMNNGIRSGIRNINSDFITATGALSDQGGVVKHIKIASSPINFGAHDTVERIWDPDPRNHSFIGSWGGSGTISRNFEVEIEDKNNTIKFQYQAEYDVSESRVIDYDYDRGITRYMAITNRAPFLIGTRGGSSLDYDWQPSFTSSFSASKNLIQINNETFDLSGYGVIIASRLINQFPLALSGPQYYRLSLDRIMTLVFPTLSYSGYISYVNAPVIDYYEREGSISNIPNPDWARESVPRNLWYSSMFHPEPPPSEQLMEICDARWSAFSVQQTDDGWIPVATPVHIIDKSVEVIWSRSEPDYRDRNAIRSRHKDLVTGQLF